MHSGEGVPPKRTKEYKGGGVQKSMNIERKGILNGPFNDSSTFISLFRYSGIHISIGTYILIFPFAPSL